MALRRGRVPVVSRAPKRKTIWVGTADQGEVAIGSGLSVVISSFDPSLLSILKATVVRVRGIFQMHPTIMTGTDLVYGGAYGLCIVSDEALAAGAGSIPRPFDDDDWAGWFVHGYYAGRLEDDVDGNIFAPPSTFIDSKAMRKVGPGESIVWMVESQFGAVQATIHARVLMMLS